MSRAMRKVGVTGGSGFIGGYVVERLAAKGYQVAVFDRRQYNSELVRTLAGMPRQDREAVSIFMGDILDELAVREFAAHVDGIVHLASVLGTQETVSNPANAVMTNTMGAVHVFQAASQYDLPVVNICVGNSGMANPYSASKTCVESLAHMYRNDRDLRVNQVRAVNAYGPRQVPAAPYGPSKVRKIVPAFVCRALAGDPVEVYGSGGQTSEMVWVGDVARVLVRALEFASRGDVVPEVVEIGSGEHLTVRSVAQCVVDTVARRADDDGYDPQVPIVSLPMRPGETPGAVVVANNTTLELLDLPWRGWQVQLNDGIRRTVEWYRENWLPTYQAEQVTA